jgi:alpha-tubulin suppressor-like RCC1 family protein
VKCPLLRIVPFLLVAACDDPFAADEVRFYQAVATGGEHTCAIALDGSAWCWGRGNEGQLGIGVKENRHTPARVAGNVDYTDVTVGVAHTCALAVDGSAHCWGWNAFYERGNTSDPRDDVPVPVSTSVRFDKLSAGDHHTCGIGTDSLAYCWGANTHGQLGDGTTRTRAEPRLVSGTVRFAHITAGGAHTCALTAVGTAYCWGRNEVGQLGIGTTSLMQSSPLLVNSAARFRQIDAGAVHTCAVDMGFFFYCWGGNEYGELGFGGNNPPGQSGSVAPSPISPFFPRGSSVSAGDRYTCAIGFVGEGRCWGRGDAGQLASGANATQFHPQPIHLQPHALHTGDFFTITQIAAGGATHACAIADDRVYCWGTGTAGQLGTQGSTYTFMPQQVSN